MGADFSRVSFLEGVAMSFLPMQLAQNNFLSSSRQPAGLPGPTGDTFPLDPETMAIEIESLGIVS
jgi:hypothetical protein